MWASPFTYRSFSWRQTLIDEPLWVLAFGGDPGKPCRRTKSGVLITADLDGTGPDEDAGGHLRRVSAAPWTERRRKPWCGRSSGVELITMFKSPYRRLLTPGGSEIVPSTGSEYVLSEAELERPGQRPPPASATASSPRPVAIGRGAALGRRVRIRRGQALAVPDPPLHRERLSGQRAGAGRLRSAAEPAAPIGRPLDEEVSLDEERARDG